MGAFGPRRRLADWTPDAGPLPDWLARWAEAGWLPEVHSSGVAVQVAGRWVTRFALVEPVLAPSTAARVPARGD